MWTKAAWPLLVLLVPMTAIAKDLLVFENVGPTVYYDNLSDMNGDPGSRSDGTSWAEGEAYTHVVESLCESDRDGAAKKMSEYKNNQIVAIDRTYIEGNDEQATANRRKFCGKQVRVFLPDGTEYISPGGDLFVWDGCLECKRVFGHKVDFSAPDFFRMTGYNAHEIAVGQNKFRVTVTDKQIVEPDGHPPDRLEGKDTFKVGDQHQGPKFLATAEQGVYFDAESGNFPELKDIPEMTETGWKGETPAGTGNVQPQPDQYGAGPEPREGDQGESFGPSSGGDQGSTSSEQSGSSDGAQQKQQQGPSAQTQGEWLQTQQQPTQPTAPVGASPSTSPDGNANPGANPNDGHGPDTGAGAGGGAPNGNPPDLSQKQAEGIQPAASGVAEISAGSCTAGAHRCEGKMPQVCGPGADGQFAWQSSTECPGTCQQEGGNVWCA